MVKRIIMKQKIIETKQDFYWHFVDTYLDLLTHVAIAYEDKTFRDMLLEIKLYLDEKLKLNVNGEIIETYVTVLQERDK